MRGVAAMVLAAALSACTEPTSPPSEPMAAAPATDAPVLPGGYASRAVVHRLEDPRAILFDAAGDPLVLEGVPARLSRVAANGSLVPVAQGGGNGPWTGAARADGRLFVAEAGGPRGGRILEIRADGTITPLPVKLPGDGLVGPLAAAPDGWLHVAIASATALGRPGRDVPCQDSPGARGRVPCTGAILRLHPDDPQPRLQSWGWRAPAALTVAADGRVLVADRVATASELHQAVAGVWYGWPESQLAASDPAADRPNPPPRPLARIEEMAAAIAVAGGTAFGGPDWAFLALPEAGMVAFAPAGGGGGPPVPFAANLRRPAALAFSPAGDELWVADAGTGILWRITPHAAALAPALPPAAPSATPATAQQGRPPRWTTHSRSTGACGRSC